MTEITKRKILYIDDKKRLLTYINKKAEIIDINSKYFEETTTIYHIALKNKNKNTNYGIYANGLLVESCSINCLLDSNIKLICYLS